MQLWQNYVVGTLIGPVRILCDGRNRGDHKERSMGVWWQDDRGLQMWAGRPLGNARDDRQADDPRLEDRTGHFGGRGRNYHVAACRECGLDAQGNQENFARVIDTLIMSGIDRVALRDVCRLVQVK